MHFFKLLALGRMGGGTDATENASSSPLKELEPSTINHHRTHALTCHSFISDYPSHPFLFFAAWDRKRFTVSFSIPVTPDLESVFYLHTRPSNHDAQEL
jgi:hypothetical protein